MIRGAVAVAAATVATVFGPATAHADSAAEVAYLHEVTRMGFLVYDVPETLATGYGICNDLNYASGERVAQSLFVNTPWVNIPTIDWARAWVVAAADTLCPWQWHPTPESLV